MPHGRRDCTSKAATAAKAPAPKKPAAAKAEHELHALVMKLLDQDKGEDIISINLAGKTAIADYMIIVSGRSSRQVSSMASNLRDRLSAKGIRARVEGQQTGDWVVVDAGDVIVHIFRPEVREFYNLEKLWSSDFSTVDYTLYQAAP